ncbi:hypothetical protein [Streptomyces sp. NPDC058667]|uniref:hypothetical protein n=1 Tax=Streptomyces sp. NPDC058667 TaxID=3346588 RepID=UPI00364ACC86
MAKGPAVIGVLTQPAPPTWWKAHRHQVFGAFGLIAGFYIGLHSTGSDAAPANTPAHPVHISTASPSPSR